MVSVAVGARHLVWLSHSFRRKMQDSTNSISDRKSTVMCELTNTNLQLSAIWFVWF